MYLSDHPKLEITTEMTLGFTGVFECIQCEGYADFRVNRPGIYVKNMQRDGMFVYYYQPAWFSYCSSP